MDGLKDTRNQTIYWYVIPPMSTAVAAVAPVLLLYFLGNATLGEELKMARGRPLSVLSVLIIATSAPFLLSNYEWTDKPLGLYAIYSVILALVNLIADRMSKKRVWPLLWFWHMVNLINLLGGKPSALFQPYSMAEPAVAMEPLRAGINYASFIVPIRNPHNITEVYDMGKCFGESLKMFNPAWCNDTWLAVQLLTSFFYVVLHCIAFFLVSDRLAKYYGGSLDGAMRNTLGV